MKNRIDIKVRIEQILVAKTVFTFTIKNDNIHYKLSRLCQISGNNPYLINKKKLILQEEIVMNCIDEIKNAF